MNITLTDVGLENVTTITGLFIENSTVNETAINYTSQSDVYGIFAKYEFLRLKPWIAFPVIIVITIASAGGIFGNVLVLAAIARCKNLQRAESAFIFNLALSDLYVTAIADPMSIIGKC